MKTFLLALFSLMLTASSVAAQLPVDGQNNFTQNILINPGFENGTYGWTASGGATKTVNTTAKGEGNYGYDWDSNSAAQTLLSNSVTIPNGLKGRNGVAYCGVETPSGAGTYTISVNDGTNDITTAQTITTSSSSFARQMMYFTFPSSGTIRIKLTSVASNEPEIYIDSCFIGDGSAFLPAGAIVTDWVSYTPTFNGYGSPSSVTFFSRRVGDSLEVSGRFTAGTVIGSQAQITVGYAGQNANVTIDVSKGEASGLIGSANGSDATTTLFGIYPLMPTSNGTFINIGVQTSTVGSYLAATGNATTVSTGVINVHFVVPIVGWTSGETAVRPDYPGLQWTAYTPVLTGNISGTFTNTTTTGFYRCDGDTLEISAESVFSGAPGTASGYFQWSLPSGFTADTTKILTTSVGQQAVGYAQGLDNGTSWYRGIVQYQDTTHVTAVMSDTGNQAAPGTPFTWGSADLITLYARVPVTANSPCTRIRAPVLVGSVTSNSVGAERVERAQIVCSSSSSITSQSGSWISSVANISSSRCAITIASGMFSAAPMCVAAVDSTSTATINSANINTTSSTTVSIGGLNQASGVTTPLSTGTYDVICMGPR